MLAVILLAECVVVFPSTDIEVKHFLLLITSGFFFYFSVWMRDSEGKLDINEFGNKIKISVLGD